MTTIEKFQWLKQWYSDHKQELTGEPAMVEAIRNNSKLRGVIHDLWFALFNKTIGGCVRCQADALVYLLAKRTEVKIKNIMECKFKLKQGVLLTDSKGKLPDATIANLTDEIAVAYLKDNPKRAQFFEVIPKDWDKPEKEPQGKAEEKSDPTPSNEAKSPAEPKKGTKKGKSNKSKTSKK